MHPLYTRSSVDEQAVPGTTEHALSCADCPNFKPHNDGTDKGWCCLFDHYARAAHVMTGDCVNTMDEQTVAQAELDTLIIAQSQEIAPEIEVDSDIDSDFGIMYRVWYGYYLLGTFYQAADGKWIAQPCDSDDRPRCNTAAEAQLLIVAMSGLLVADTAEDVIDLIDKPFDELTVAEWQFVKQQAMQAETLAA